MAKKEEIKITALYERLSRDDEQAGESNSIKSAVFRSPNVLPAVDGSTACGFVNLNPVNERIEHGIGQFLAVPVLPDQSDKAGCVHLLDLVLLNQTFQLCNTLFQHKLFFIVLLDHALRLSLRQ